jgi:hypothetical protein
MWAFSLSTCRKEASRGLSRAAVMKVRGYSARRPGRFPALATSTPPTLAFDGALRLK